MKLNPQQTSSQTIKEGLEKGDLSRLVHDELHIDEYKSKMGKDEDIVVISFKVGGKEPAVDLVNFVEKGYSWVLDADNSSGEMEDGDYVVFVEVERNAKVPSQIMKLLEDLVGLTDNKLDNWRVRYHKNPKEVECNKETLTNLIPLTPEEYLRRVSKDTEEIDKLKAVSGVRVNTTAPKNEFTESLRIAAGIK
jgi:hypothetical protein